MTARGRGTTIPRSAGRLVWLCGVSALWLAWNPPGANAGCGDYVIIGKAPQAHDEPLRGPIPDHSPCRGPYCTGNPDGVPTSPSVTPLVSFDRWANVALAALAPPGAVEYRSWAELPIFPIHSTADIFHPPRTA